MLKFTKLTVRIVNKRLFLVRIYDYLFKHPPIKPKNPWLSEYQHKDDIQCSDCFKYNFIEIGFVVSNKEKSSKNF